MAQTDPNSYGYALNVAQAGQLGDIGPHRIDTKASEGATAFGKAVKRGTDPQKQAEVIDNAADAFYGVAVFTHATEQGFNRATSPASTGAEYKDGDAMSVLREGRVYVEATESVLSGDRAYWDLNSGDAGYTFRPNEAVLTFDADLVTANEIDGQVNGEAITTVTFDTDTATTLALLAAEIEAVLEGQGATRVSTAIDATERTLTVSASVAVAFASFAVTEGAGQAGVAESAAANIGPVGEFQTGVADGGIVEVDIVRGV